MRSPSLQSISAVQLVLVHLQKIHCLTDASSYLNAAMLCSFSVTSHNLIGQVAEVGEV
jgi:hypothetical protein